MADNTNTNTDPAASGTTAGAPATSGQPLDWESESNPYKVYEKRFKGTQTALQQVTSERDGLVLKRSEVEESLRKALGDKEALDLSVKDWQGKHTQAYADLVALQGTHERTTTVMTQFPDLLPFLGKDAETDLLPNGTGEELVKKLTAFKDALSKKGNDLARSVMDGTTPAAPQPKTDVGAKELLASANDALMNGDEKKYNELYDQYVQKLSAKV